MLGRYGIRSCWCEVANRNIVAKVEACIDQGCSTSYLGVCSKAIFTSCIINKDWFVQCRTEGSRRSWSNWRLRSRDDNHFFACNGILNDRLTMVGKVCGYCGSKLTACLAIRMRNDS